MSLSCSCSASVAIGGAGWLWVGSLPQHGGVGKLGIPAHRLGYALRYGVEALEVTPLLGHGCVNPLCERINLDHVRPRTHADTQRAAKTQPQADGAPHDAGAQRAPPRRAAAPLRGTRWRPCGRSGE